MFYESDKYKVKKTHFIRKMEDLSVDDYLLYFVSGQIPDKSIISDCGRIIAGCKHMAEVSANLVSRIIEDDVYTIGRVLPTYVKGRRSKVDHEHYFNAFVNEGKIIYFDSAVYKNFFNIFSNEWESINNCNLNFTNLDFDTDIKWSNYLQNRSNISFPQKREISLLSSNSGNSIIIDNFATKKLIRGYFYSKVSSEDGRTFFYYLKNDKVYKQFY